MKMKSLPEIIHERASATPDARAYTFLEDGERDGDTLTWSALAIRSRNLAVAIALSARPGSRVLLLFPPGLEFVPAFFGSLRARTIAVLAYPPAGTRADRVIARLRGVAADAAFSLVVAPGAVFAKRDTVAAFVPELADVPWLNGDEAVGYDGPVDAGTPDLADVALLQYTSGSTSKPRGVMVTHGNLLHNLAASASLANHGAGSIGVTWLPVNHDMGLIDGVLQPAFSGFPVSIMSPAAFLQRPARWLHAISRLRATHSGGPDFAYGLCVARVGRDDRAALDLSTWRTAFNGSEPVRYGTMEAFQRAFGECGFRWEAFRPAYGLAESTLLVTSSVVDEDPHLFHADSEALRSGNAEPAATGRPSVTLVSCGSATRGTTVAIVDPVRLTRCAAGRVGEIWVHGDSVAAGYWQSENSKAGLKACAPYASVTAATFEAQIGDGDDRRFLRTGDLGFMRGGHLFVTGRIKDLLIVRGVKHYPQDVELTVEHAHASIRPHGSAAFAHQQNGQPSVAIVAEIVKRADNGTCPQSELSAIAAAVAQAVCAAHGFVPGTIALVDAGAVPRTTSGKAERYRCSQLLDDQVVLRHRWSPTAIGVDGERRKAAS